MKAVVNGERGTKRVKYDLKVVNLVYAPKRVKGRSEDTFV